MNEMGFFSHCVPKKFSGSCLEKCDQQPQRFHDYAKAWGVKPESVILMGPAGRGKTQFAFAMIREMFLRCEKPLWPRYYTSPQIDSILLEAIKSEGGDKFKIESLGTEELLFIDDFGRETNSERIKRQYFEILNYRYANDLPTLISTNLTLQEIGIQMNAAIASRFQEWQMIQFEGGDLRIQRKVC